MGPGETQPAPETGAGAVVFTGGLALKVVAGKAAGTTIELGPEPVVLGRASSGPEALRGDPELSRRHARISRFDGRLLIEDLGSTNGTFVNGGVTAGPTVLSPGDTVWVGTTTLLVQPVDEPLPVVTPVEPPLPSAEAGMLSRLANVSTRHPKQILVGIIVFALFAFAVGFPGVSKLRDEGGFDDPASQYVKVYKTLGRLANEYPIPFVILIRPGMPVNSPAAIALVTKLHREIAADPKVSRIVDLTTPGAAPLLTSIDGRETNMQVFFHNVNQRGRENATEALRKKYEHKPEIEFGGQSAALFQLRHQVADDLHKAEAIGFPLLFIVSIFVFRGVIAALLPILVGAVTVAGTSLILLGISKLVFVDVFSLNIVTALGLGLSIDYSLFIISRYREELAKVGRGRPANESYGATSGVDGFAGSQREAMRRTLMTAGRTITFSSITVAVAMASLVIFRQPFIMSMGLGGAVTAVVAVTVALIVLPVVITLLGPRLNAGAPRSWRRSAMRVASGDPRGFWYRLANWVMARPALVAIAAATVMIVIGLSFTRIQFTAVNESALPPNLTAKQVDSHLNQDFATNPEATVVMEIRGPASARSRVDRIASRLKTFPDVADVVTPNYLGHNVWRSALHPWSEGLDQSSINLVKKIRTTNFGLPVLVGGEAASQLDQLSSVGAHLPIALGVLVAVTIMVLFVMTGSVVLPVKSLLMNFLTISASLGILVLIFQDGRLQSLLGFTSNGKIDSTEPVLIVAVAFGLSTDYAVFLLTRIIEARKNGADDRQAVALGLERTGRIVTQAALLFCLAIGAFTTSKVEFIKEVGVGIAAGVLIDATIMRGLLVPSLMALLGRRNWWAPRPLRRLHNKIGLSEE